MKLSMLKGLVMLALIFIVSCSHETLTTIRWDTGSLQEVVNPPGNMYAYAPAVIKDGNIEHIYTCHNSEDGVIRDSVYYMQRTDGTATLEKEVLEHGADGSWDSQNVCDTSIVEGKFVYNDMSYKYAMFYLGNNLPCSCNNQIGVAFANDLAADSWVKYPDPVITYPLDGVSWGVGQQSAISMDGKGKVLLFYMLKDLTNTLSLMRVEADLSDMAGFKLAEPVEVPNDGLAGIGGLPNNLDNVDLAYDKSRDRFYAVTEMQPYPADNPDYISEAEQIVSIAAKQIWDGEGTWRHEGTIDAALTGFKRNHNTGIFRTAAGELPSPDEITVMFTKSCAGSQCVTLPEWTYDVWEIKGKLP